MDRLKSSKKKKEEGKSASLEAKQLLMEVTSK